MYVHSFLGWGEAGNMICHASEPFIEMDSLIYRDKPSLALHKNKLRKPVCIVFFFFEEMARNKPFFLGPWVRCACCIYLQSSVPTKESC